MRYGSVSNQESMRFCGAVMEGLRATLFDGQVNVSRWWAPELVLSQTRSSDEKGADGYDPLMRQLG